MIVQDEQIREALNKHWQASQALRSHHPGKPSGFNVRRILGKGDLWITEYAITYQGGQRTQ
jgi:hypothetical protein